MFRSCRAAVLLLSLALAGPAAAQDSEPGLWERLQGEIAAQGERLQSMLGRQQAEDTAGGRLERQLEHTRQMRALHREAVLLTELNRAWIEDQLTHWDCRVADRRRAQARSRWAELSGLGERLSQLCADLGSGDEAQQRVCARQREALSASMMALERIAERPEAACGQPDIDGRAAPGREPTNEVEK